MDTERSFVQGHDAEQVRRRVDGQQERVHDRTVIVDVIVDAAEPLEVCVHLN
jgi:hypothetical protein